MGGIAVIKKLFKDKKGAAMFIYALSIIVATLMFIWYQTAFSQLIVEKNKLLKITDEAAIKAVWEIYEYQSSHLQQSGTIDTQAFQKAVNKAVEVFASNGYTLRNANITIEKGYLVLRGNVNFYYKKPTLLNSLTPAEEISIPLEGKTVLKKLK